MAMTPDLPTRSTTTRLGPLALALLLGACGGGDDTTAPGDATVGEARALDEAAEMIEQRRLPDSALKPVAPPAQDAAAATQAAQSMPPAP